MHLSRRRTDMQMIRTHPQKAARRILPPTGGQNPKKAFPASARRIALQNAAANADRNRSISVPAWSPLTVTASVSQKRTVCRCQQTPVPGRHRRCRSSRNAGAPAACRLILPRTARAVRLFCGELLSVRKSIPETDAAVPHTVPLRGNRSPGCCLPLIIPDSGGAVKCGLRKMHKKAALF